MSKFSLEYLISHSKQGFARQHRGWVADCVGAKPGDGYLYNDAIPAKHATELLASVKPVKAEISLSYLNADGETVTVSDPANVGLLDSATGEVFHYPTADYAIHDFAEFGQKVTSTVVSDTLKCASVGILGGKAYITYQTPENLKNEKTGMAFRTWIAFLSSIDGTWASTWKLGNTLVVCDNTAEMMRAEKGNKYSKRHSKFSASNIDADSIRTALGLWEAQAEGFNAQLDSLASMPVDAAAFDRFMALAFPIPAQAGRGATRAENKQDTLRALYAHDERVSPWAGTALGVVQMVSTYAQHASQVRVGDGSPIAARAAKNTLATFGSVNTFGDTDRDTLKVLEMAVSAS